MRENTYMLQKKNSFVCLFFCFYHSFIHSFNHSFNHSFIHSFIQFIHSFIYSFIHSLRQINTLSCLYILQVQTLNSIVHAPKPGVHGGKTAKWSHLQCLTRVGEMDMSPWHQGGCQVMRPTLNDASGRCEDVNPVLQGPGCWSCSVTRDNHLSTSLSSSRTRSLGHTLHKGCN